MKTFLKAITFFSVLTVFGTVSLNRIPPAQAQRVCIIDSSDNVVCGRPATERDLRRYDSGSPNRSRENAYDEINKIYNSVLGRDARSKELRTYARDLDRGSTPKAIRRELAQSEEAQQQINQIYREVLGRDADTRGKRTFTSKLVDGHSLRDVRRDIERSDEARKK